MARSSQDLLAGILGTAQPQSAAPHASREPSRPVAAASGRRRSSDLSYERTTVNLPVGLRLEMREWALAHDTSMSALVTDAVRAYMDGRR